jgi:phospholipase/carboxylesterase
MIKEAVSLTHLARHPSVPTPGKPPLILLLHGVGSNEQDLFGLADYLDDRFLVVSLRAPQVIGPGAYGWYHIDFTPQGLIYDPADAERGRMAAAQAIDEVVNAYDADSDRVYLMGFSQGAVMSLSNALLLPEKIAGAVIMSGGLLPEIREKVAPENRLAGLPVFVAHGKYDPVLPVQAGRKIRDFLQTKPVDLTYREYPMAHQVSAESIADVAAWLSVRLDAPGDKTTL